MELKLLGEGKYTNLLNGTTANDSTLSCLLPGVTDESSKAFANNHTLSVHLPVISWNFCSMVHRSSSEGQRSKQLKASAKLQRCDECPKAFRYPYHLRRHKWLIHAPGRPVFKCNICYKSYKSEELFQLHQSLAHSQQTAGQTRKTSQSSSGKASNSDIETDDYDIDVVDDCAGSRFWCPICGTSFKQKHYLAQHLTAHSDSRPFVCEVCKKGFSRASTLFAHRQVHADGRNFHCGSCSKVFKHKRSLTEHTKAKICSAHAQNNANQEATTTDANPTYIPSVAQLSKDGYPCEFCGVVLESVTYLHMHRRRRHREKIIGDK